MSHLFYALANLLAYLLELYRYAVIIAVLLSLVNADPFNGLVRFFRVITEPVFIWIRRRLPFVVVAGLDLSPLVLILIILFAEQTLPPILRDLAHGA